MSDEHSFRRVRQPARRRFELDADDEDTPSPSYGWPTVRPAQPDEGRSANVIRDEAITRRLSAMEARLTSIEEHLRAMASAQQSLQRLFESILVTSSPGKPIVITRKP
nr:VP4 protein [Nuomin virus]